MEPTPSGAFTTFTAALVSQPPELPAATFATAVAAAVADAARTVH